MTTTTTTTNFAIIEQAQTDVSLRFLVQQRNQLVEGQIDGFIFAIEACCAYQLSQMLFVWTARQDCSGHSARFLHCLSMYCTSYVAHVAWLQRLAKVLLTIWQQEWQAHNVASFWRQKWCTESCCFYLGASSSCWSCHQTTCTQWKAQLCCCTLLGSTDCAPFHATSSVWLQYHALRICACLATAAIYCGGSVAQRSWSIGLYM